MRDRDRVRRRTCSPAVAVTVWSAARAGDGLAPSAPATASRHPSHRRKRLTHDSGQPLSGTSYLQLDRLRLHHPRPQRLQRAEHDRQVLDRQAGRVEQRDLGRRLAAGREAGADRSRAPSRPRDATIPCGDRARQLAAVARLVPLVAEEPALGSDARRSPRRVASALPGPSAPSRFRCWPARRRRRLDHRLVARGDGADDVAGERLGEVADLPAELRRDAAPAASGSGSKHTPGPYSASAMQRPTHVPCSPQPIEPDRRGVLARELLGCDRRRGAGPQRGDRAGVEHRQRLAVVRVGHQHDAGHGRQAAARVAGKRGHPLQRPPGPRRAPASRGSRRSAGSAGRPWAASATRRARSSRTRRARARSPRPARRRRARRRGRVRECVAMLDTLSYSMTVERQAPSAAGPRSS